MAVLEKKAFTIEEAAAAYSVSTSFVRAAINRGELGSKRVGAASNGKRLLSVEALREWYDNLPEG